MPKRKYPPARKPEEVPSQPHYPALIFETAALARHCGVKLPMLTVGWAEEAFGERTVPNYPKKPARVVNVFQRLQRRIRRTEHEMKQVEKSLKARGIHRFEPSDPQSVKLQVLDRKLGRLVFKQVVHVPQEMPAARHYQG